MYASHNSNESYKLGAVDAIFFENVKSFDSFSCEENYFTWGYKKGFLI
jgi:hypothetical protein